MRTNRAFEVVEMVYLRLQPFQQSTLKKRRAEKLQPRFFGPYKILCKIAETAYELPRESKIHNTFHVSLLKVAVGQQDTSSTTLPSLDEEGRLVLILEKVLEIRVKKLRSRKIREYLIKWKDLPNEDSTWEGAKILAHPPLNFLRASNFERGGFIPSNFVKYN